MKKFSIKRIKRLIDDEKPMAIARYLRHFLPEEKRSLAGLRLDLYAHELVKKGTAEKSEVLKRLKEIERNAI